MVAGCLVTAAAASPDPEARAIAGYLVLLALVIWLARASASQRVLLRLAIVSRMDPALAARALAALSDRPACPRVRACVVASLAELELFEGDVDRARQLYTSLRARGWEPADLVDGWTRGHAVALDAAATFAAFDGDGAETERAMARMAGAPLLRSVGLLRATAAFRREDLEGVRVALDPIDDRRADGRGRAIALLRALAGSGRRGPYRAGRDASLARAELGRFGWLVSNAPALAAGTEARTAELPGSR